MSEPYEFVFKLMFQAATRGTWELAKWLVHWTHDLTLWIPRIKIVFALREEFVKVIASIVRYHIIRLMVSRNWL